MAEDAQKHAEDAHIASLASEAAAEEAIRKAAEADAIAEAEKEAARNAAPQLVPDCYLPEEATIYPNPEIDLASNTTDASNRPVDISLPAGWQQMWDTQNHRDYYVDHNTRTTHWQLPQVIKQQEPVATNVPAQPKPPPPPSQPAPTPAQDALPIEWQPAFQSMVGMGFAPNVACETLLACDGNADAAIEAALTRSPMSGKVEPPVVASLEPFEPAPAEVAAPPPAPPVKGITMLDEIDMISAAQPPIFQPPIFPTEWEALLPELAEMGFEDVATNKNLLAANHGDLKSTVTALVAKEREERKNR